jgi:hypothetical protein
MRVAPDITNVTQSVLDSFANLSWYHYKPKNIEEGSSNKNGFYKY